MLSSYYQDLNGQQAVINFTEGRTGFRLNGNFIQINENGKLSWWAQHSSHFNIRTFNFIEDIRDLLPSIIFTHFDEDATPEDVQNFLMRKT